MGLLGKKDTRRVRKREKATAGRRGGRKKKPKHEKFSLSDHHYRGERRGWKKTGGSYGGCKGQDLGRLTGRGVKTKVTEIRKATLPRGRRKNLKCPRESSIPGRGTSDSRTGRRGIRPAERTNLDTAPYRGTTGGGSSRIKGR